MNKCRAITQGSDEGKIINYSEEEHRIWKTLLDRQLQILPDRACNEYLHGLKKLPIFSEKIPQLSEINHYIYQQTGWKFVPVATMLAAKDYFKLLSSKKIPAITSIRNIKEFDCAKGPDIFHEIVGHAPMLLYSDYVDFMHAFANKALHMPESDLLLMQRLFALTAEFGLINTHQGLRVIGSGILSSVTEIVHSIESPLSMRALFNPLTVLRTPYHFEKLQNIYFVMDSFSQLFNLVNMDLTKLISQARKLGEHPPCFHLKKGETQVHINAL